jgi:hypothetical protein
MQLKLKCDCGGDAVVTAHTWNNKKRRCLCTVCGKRFLMPMRTQSGSGQIAGRIIYPGYVYGGTRLS